MVLETWATDFSSDDQQRIFVAHENPVQRRPKLDYFSQNVVNNMMPTVSHISSNGYYGYCATPISSVQSTDRETTENDDKFPMDIQMAEQGNCAVDQTLPNRVERRKRCQKFDRDDQMIVMKRCRNQTFDATEIGEDQWIYAAHNVSSASEEGKDPFSTASGTPPSNVTINEAEMVGIKQFTCIDTTTTSAPLKRTPANANYSNDRMDLNDESVAKNNCNTIDMERLFWHTHGSMLWRCDNR